MSNLRDGGGPQEEESTATCKKKPGPTKGGRKKTVFKGQPYLYLNTKQPYYDCPIVSTIQYFLMGKPLKYMKEENFSSGSVENQRIG